FFSLQWGLLPSAGCCSPTQLIMPALVLAAEGTAVTTRMVRSSMLEHLREDFVRALRAKGLPEWQVVGRHVLRNALIPVISLSGPPAPVVRRLVWAVSQQAGAGGIARGRLLHAGGGGRSLLGAL